MAFEGFEEGAISVVFDLVGLAEATVPYVQTISLALGKLHDAYQSMKANQARLSFFSTADSLFVGVCVHSMCFRGAV